MVATLPACASMEYERAVFRIYDKSMEVLRFPAARSVCWYAQKALLVLSAGLFTTLLIMHNAFVDKPGETREGLVALLYGD